MAKVLKFTEEEKKYWKQPLLSPLTWRIYEKDITRVLDSLEYPCSKKKEFMKRIHKLNTLNQKGYTSFA